MMVQRTPWTVADYDKAADKYLAGLPLEHFMESVPHAKQRKITLESLDVLSEQHSDVQVFNELLIQYLHRGKVPQVVPDNMLRVSNDELKTIRSFNVELETDQPLLVLEWVSPKTKEKDYKDSFRKYERELKVPYCLMYYPEEQRLQVWHHDGKRYQTIEPNATGRHAIPELELEVAIQDGWVRYWHRGKLLRLPGELLHELTKLSKERDTLVEKSDKLNAKLDKAEVERDAAVAEAARLRALLDQATNPSKKNNGP